MFILKDLLNKYDIDYTNFPKPILEIKVYDELKNFKEYTQETEDIIIFYGEHNYEYLIHGSKTLVKSTITVDLTGITLNEIKLYENIVNNYNNETANDLSKKYHISLDELKRILMKGLSKECVIIVHNVENSFTDFKTYNLLGGIERQG